ncbi:MAG: NUDIX hydrolase [Methylococcaceae bacterium]|jgi:8-oxo-dGTP diphosphatase
MPKPVTPLLAADVIIELTDFPDCPIVLIERANPTNNLAIPGGVVDLGEIVKQTPVREAQEEVGLDVHLIALLGIYSDPSRDTRGHTVTAVYVAEAAGKPVTTDNAKNYHSFSLNELPESLAFAHAQMLADYKKDREICQVAQLHDNPVQVSGNSNRCVIH